MPDSTYTRRGFLFSAFTGAGALYAAKATEALAQNNPKTSSMNDHGKSAHSMKMNPLIDRFPRTNPKMRLSKPPETMGRQMGKVLTPGLPPLGYERDGNVKVFRLIAQPVERTLTRGLSRAEMQKELIIPKGYEPFRPRPSQPKSMLAWGFNGVCPGPTLEATEGDRVRIIYRNELPEPSSIHWHGFELPFYQDGASGYFPFEARRPTLPGEEAVYEFDLIQSGTLMYHTGFNVVKQEALGLGGLFVVHPKKKERPVDRDFAILLQQWTFYPGNPNPDVTVMEPSFTTFNGLTSPTFPMLEVNQGERVRIRFGNLSLMYHPIHLHGYVFELVGTTGGPIAPGARWKDVTVTIGPGESRDIEFRAWNPGTWRLHCHVLHHIMNQMPNMPMGIAPPEGMFTHLHVKPSDPSYDPLSPGAPWAYPTKEERI